MIFAEVIRTELASGVAAQIRDAILAGRYQPGDVLPSERDLSSQFGANRTTIREGLTRLEHLGLIERRQGRCCRVLDFHRSGSLELVPHLVRLASSEPTVAALSPTASTIEAVRIMYEGAVDLAIDRITEDEVAQLDELATAAEVAAASGDVEDITDADRAFHQAVARATHSVVIELMVANYFRSLDAALDESGGVKRRVARSLTDLAERGKTLPHRRLAAAIGAREKDEARRIVRQMMGGG